MLFGLIVLTKPYPSVHFNATKGTGARTEKAFILEQTSGHTLSIKKLDGTIH